MSVVMEAPRAPRIVPTDRIFYTGMALACGVIVAIGFSPTFYLRDPALPPLSSLLVVHGIAYTAWIGLFVTQAALIAADRRGWHRALGAAGVALALVMVVLGTMAAIASLHLGRAPIPGLDPRTFFAIPIRNVVMFPLFVGAAVWLRHDAQAHKRLMILATISMLDAAIARFPIAAMMQVGPPLFWSLQDLLIVAGMVYDRATRGHVHKAYWWGLGLMVVSQVGTLLIAGTAPWLAFADWVLGR